MIGLRVREIDEKRRREVTGGEDKYLTTFEKTNKL